ncbi:DUF943 family protein [Trabulsiella odontotermitis]|uniref:DUF943 family protein n=1 Tax=Trabulsiella odontotermitis TaxID=379893 RepID=UPI000675ED3E|nr:DUF943 family protein [Trabulsiella odontotermitis]KNC89237.1 hypothetical protein GM30_07950 [Trabulsiella odontotermitis]
MSVTIHFRKLLATLFIIVALYNAWTLQNVNVLFVDHVWAGDYVIAVDHLPLTDRDKINWFNDNKKMLQNRYAISMEDFNEITIIEAVDGIKNINSRWIDDYYCFNHIDSDYRCVDKSLQVNVTRAQDDTVTFYIHSFGGIYVQSTDGSVQKSNYERYFDDVDDRLGTSLDRWLFH